MRSEQVEFSIFKHSRDGRAQKIDKESPSFSRHTPFCGRTEVTSKTQQFENSLNLLGILQPVTMSYGAQIFGVETQMQLHPMHSHTMLCTMSEQVCRVCTGKTCSALKTAKFHLCTEHA